MATRDKATFELMGIEEIKRKLRRIGASDDLAKAILRPTAEAIRDVAGKYPPQPAPKNPNYRYVRGRGTMYVPTGRIRRTSEQLGKRWVVFVRQNTAIIHNTATYAPYVHGSRQATIHKSTGWKQLKSVAKDELPAIGRRLGYQIRRLWNK